MSKLKKFWFIAVFTIITPFLIFTSANAELLTNPAFIYDKGDAGVELYLGKSNAKYAFPLDTVIKEDISFFSGSYAYSFGRNLNLFGTVSYNFDYSAELMGSKADGDGLTFGIGVKGEYEKFNTEDSVFTWYMQILKSDMDYDAEEGEDETSRKLLEVTAGVLLKKEIHKDIIGYAGLEYVLNSDRSEIVGINFVEGGGAELDADRKDRLGIKLGLIIPFEKSNVFIDAGFMNELSLKLGFNFPFGGSRAIAKTSSFSDQNLDERIEAQQVTTSKTNTNASFNSNQNSSEIMEERPVAISKPNMNVPDNLDQNTNRIKESQQKLFELGYDPGPIDGVAGARFQKALRLFQKNSGLQETGSLNPATIKSLGL